MAARLRSMFRPGAAEERMDEEFAFHLEMETEKLIREGMSPAEARRRALLTFGGVDRHREGMRDGRGVRWIFDVAQDTRYALRALRRSPLFTLVSLLTIAIGVGASAGIFSVANAIVLKRLPLPDARRVIAIQEKRRGNTRTEIEGDLIPFARYEAYRESMRSSVEDLAATQYRQFSVSANGVASSTPGSLVTRNFFDVLKLRLALGSGFGPRGSQDVIISDRLWRSRFGAARDVVGRTLLVDGRSFVIAGVAPRSFDGTTPPFIQDLWLPYDAFRFMSDAKSTDRWVGMIGRLRRGVSMQRAQSMARTAAHAIPVEDSDVTVTDAVVEVVTGLNGTIRKPLGAALGALTGLAILVLMIASANIAGMLLARAAARTREMAIRLSIGAGRTRIVRQLLTETLVLFLIGGCLGVFVAYAMARGFSSLGMPMRVPVVLDVHIDFRVLLFALCVASFTAFVFGLAPALNASRADLVAGLKDGAPGDVRTGTRMRSLFVGGQLTIAVVLLMVAALFVRSMQRTSQSRLGFDPNGISVGTIDVAALGYTEDQANAFFDQLAANVKAEPKVQSVAVADRMIMGGSHNSGGVSAAADQADRVNASFERADTAYLGTLAMEIVSGRGITNEDRSGGIPVVVVNETLARMLWHTLQATGRQMYYGGTAYTVVGVVRDAKYAFITDKPEPVAIFPLAQHYRAERTIYVRSHDASAATLQMLREKVSALDPAAAVQSAMALPTAVRAALFPLRFISMLLSAFGLLGLILAILGVYGVLSYHVSQRTREFGIRIALGATTRDVRALVLGRGALMIVIAILIGGALGYNAARLMRGMVPGVSPWDSAAFIGAPAALLVTALLASYLPARRAMQIDPSRALRND